MGLSPKPRLLALFLIGAMTPGCSNFLADALTPKSDYVGTVGISAEKAEQIAVQTVGGRAIPSLTKRMTRASAGLQPGTMGEFTELVYVVQIESTSDAPMRSDSLGASTIGIDGDYKPTYKSGAVTIRAKDGVVLAYSKVPTDDKPARTCKPLELAVLPSNTPKVGDTVVVQYQNVPDGNYDVFLGRMDDDSRAFDKMVKLPSCSPTNHMASFSVEIKSSIDTSGRAFPIQSGDRFYVHLLTTGWSIGAPIYVQ